MKEDKCKYCGNIQDDKLKYCLKCSEEMGKEKKGETDLTTETGLKGVKGWLLLFCITRGFYGVSCLLSGLMFLFLDIKTETEMSIEVNFVILGIGILNFYAAYLIIHQKKNAKIVALLSTFLPPNAFSLLWFFYILLSKRVKNTLNNN